MNNVTVRWVYATIAAVEKQ